MLNAREVVENILELLEICHLMADLARLEGVKQSDKFHQTGKPTPLMVALMDLVDPGGVVLDPFAGSSTTGVGALTTGRRFIGIEKVDAYREISRERLESVPEFMGLPESELQDEPTTGDLFASDAPAEGTPDPDGAEPPPAE